MVNGEVKKGEVYLYWIGRKEPRGTELKRLDQAWLSPLTI